MQRPYGVVARATVAVSPLLGEVALLCQNFLRHFEVVQRDRQLVLQVQVREDPLDPPRILGSRR